MYVHVKQLIQEKREALEILDHQQVLSDISEIEAASCRRSILQGIEQLETLLSNMEKAKSSL